MKRLFLALALLSLTACKGGGSTIESSEIPDLAPPVADQPDDPPADPQDPGNTDPTPAQPQSVVVTYYTLSKTVAPMGSWPTKTYTAMGACAEINSKVFCWDDGVKTLTWVSGGTTYGPYYYTYFGLKQNGAGFSICSGGCATDFMEEPTLINVSLDANIGTQVDQIFMNGAMNQANCTQTDNVIDCGEYQFDLGSN